MAKTNPLRKVTDDSLWDAECTFRRLCVVAHAAFVYEGFLPVGEPTASTTRYLSRAYSLPKLQGEDLVVLRLFRRPRRRGDRSRMVLYICASYNTNHAGGCIGERRERLDSAAVEAVLSSRLDETARALRTPGSLDQWLWKLLADRFCRGLFLDVCRMNGVPVEPGFASLPGDVKALIVSRLDSAKDVAMAECACKELRHLAAEHDAQVWEAKCDKFCGRILHKTKPNMTWKQTYINIHT